MLKANPCDKSGTEGEVEEAFVRYCEDDEDGRECEEDDDKSMKIMAVGLEAVEEWYYEGSYQYQPSCYLISQG